MKTYQISNGFITFEIWQQDQIRGAGLKFYLIKFYQSFGMIIFLHHNILHYYYVLFGYQYLKFKKINHFSVFFFLHIFGYMLVDFDHNKILFHYNLCSISIFFYFSIKLSIYHVFLFTKNFQLTAQKVLQMHISNVQSHLKLTKTGIFIELKIFHYFWKNTTFWIYFH